MKRRLRKNNLQSQMNVVPYIDVMLVLLVIFMVTAPMFTPGVINLPSVGKSAQVDTKPIEINIDKEGNYSLSQNGKNVAFTSVDELVQKTVTSATEETPVVISADKTVEYDRVIGIVDKLYSAGIKKVALVVKQKNG